MRLVAAKFVWRGMKKDVRAWSDTCVACQRAKVHRHTKAPLEQFIVPERRFDHVNVDLVGPLPSSQGFTYLLTMVDRTTRWPEAVPLTSTSAADVARAFISTWVARFGTHADLSSDRGAQFTSELWNAMAESLGVKLHRTTAYHPQANGLCERFHRSMKAALRAALADCNWIDKLPWVMLGLRTAPKEDLQSSSAELVFGQPLRVPGDFLPSTTAPWSLSVQRTSLQDSARAFAPVPTSQHGTPASRVPADLQSAGYVFIRHDAHRGPLRPPYDGPFRVLEHAPKHLVVDIGEGLSMYQWTASNQRTWTWTSHSSWPGLHGGADHPAQVSRLASPRFPLVLHPPALQRRRRTLLNHVPLSSFHGVAGAVPLSLLATVTLCTDEFWGGSCGDQLFSS